MFVYVAIIEAMGRMLDARLAPQWHIETEEGDDPWRRMRNTEGSPRKRP